MHDKQNHSHNTHGLEMQTVRVKIKRYFSCGRGGDLNKFYLTSWVAGVFLHVFLGVFLHVSTCVD